MAKGTFGHVRVVPNSPACEVAHVDQRPTMPRVGSGPNGPGSVGRRGMEISHRYYYTSSTSHAAKPECAVSPELTGEGSFRMHRAAINAEREAGEIPQDSRRCGHDAVWMVDVLSHRVFRGLCSTCMTLPISRAVTGATPARICDQSASGPDRYPGDFRRDNAWSKRGNLDVYTTIRRNKRESTACLPT